MDPHRRYRLPRQSFWTGVAKIFSFGTLRRDRNHLFDEGADERALRSDWEAVGRDLQWAIYKHVPDIEEPNCIWFSVTEYELQRFRSAHAAVNLSFLGIAFGVALTLAITAVTATFDDRGAAIVFANFGWALVATVYFAIQAFNDWKAAAEQVRLITERRLE